MKKLILMCGVAAAALGFTACNGGSSSAPKTFEDSLAYYLGTVNGQGLKSQIQQYMANDTTAKFNEKYFLMGMKTVLDADTSSENMESYMMGLQQGMQLLGTYQQLKDAGITMDLKTLYNAMAANMKNFKDSVNMDEFQANQMTLQGLYSKAQGIMMAKRDAEQKAAMEEMKKLYDKNAAAGKAFMDKVKKEAGVVTTESGLAYKVTKKGEGEVAKSGDRVNVKYTGKLIDGTEFDSSKGEAVSMSTLSVIPGFKEALTTLPAGTVATVYIPENLGYGSQAAGTIEPGSTLVFDIEVVGTVVPDKTDQMSDPERHAAK